MVHQERGGTHAPTHAPHHQGAGDKHRRQLPEAASGQAPASDERDLEAVKSPDPRHGAPERDDNGKCHKQGIERRRPLRKPQPNGDQEQERQDQDDLRNDPRPQDAPLGAAQGRPPPVIGAQESAVGRGPHHHGDTERENIHRQGGRDQTLLQLDPSGIEDGDS